MTEEYEQNLLNLENNNNNNNNNWLKMIKYYNVKPTIIVIYVWTTAICLTINSHNIIKTTFLHWGPGDAYFITIPIDSWEKWTYLMIYSFFSQVVYSFVNITIAPFITNVIRDYKNNISLPQKYILIIVFSYKTYIWFHEILEVFLTLTLQLQFYLPAIIADIIISIFSAWDYNKASKTIR
tara:strand:+ start:538 stop:1080 length:543 start_codon:yes stop_codon:yes gene_type:complete